MARIKANAHVFIQLNSRNYRCDFLERTADFTALTSHGFEQQNRRLLGCQHGIQSVGNHLDSCICALPHMGAGVHVVKLAGHDLLHALEIAG